MPELSSSTSNWVQDTTELHAVSDNPPTNPSFIPIVSLNTSVGDQSIYGANLKSKPSVNPLWDDPFGLSMTIEANASTYESSNLGLQEQSDIWAFAELSTS